MNLQAAQRNIIKKADDVHAPVPVSHAEIQKALGELKQGKKKALLSAAFAKQTEKSITEINVNFSFQNIVGYKIGQRRLRDLVQYRQLLSMCTRMLWCFTELKESGTLRRLTSPPTCISSGISGLLRRTQSSHSIGRLGTS